MSLNPSPNVMCGIKHANSMLQRYILPLTLMNRLRMTYDSLFVWLRGTVQ